MGRRLALLIATHEHEDPTLRRLTSPAADVESLAAVLRDPQIAGFEVSVLVNEPHYRVGEAVAGLYRDRRRDDLTLLYFTGHGLKDDDGRLYLATSNTRRDSLLFTSLPAEQLDYAMEGCASRQKVLVLDCCYSGAFPAGRGVKADTEVHALEKLQGRGRTVLTASDSTQYSFEGDRVHGSATQSVFTRHLVEGLRDGSADLDGDGDITVDELYSYVHDRVVEEMPSQRPKKQSNVEGRLVIARNVAWTMPGYLRNALDSPIANDRLSALDALMHLHRIGNPSVRAQVVVEIERLVDDDSRSVAAAAETRLRAIRPAAQSALAAATDVPDSRIESVRTSSEPTVAPSPPAHAAVVAGRVFEPPAEQRRPAERAADTDEADAADPASSWWRWAYRILAGTPRRLAAVAAGVVAVITAAVLVPILVTTGDGDQDGPGTAPAPALVIGTIAVGDAPGGMDFFDDGGRLAVATFEGRFVLVDRTTNTVIGELDLPGGGADVAVALEGSRTYAATGSGLYEVDTSLPLAEFRRAVIDGEEVYSVTAAGDGNLVFAATHSGVAVVDAQTGDIRTTIDLPGQKFGLAGSPDGGRVYVGNADLNTVSVVDPGASAVIDTIETGAFTLDVALSPDAARGYVAQESAVGVFRTDTSAPLVTIPVPGEGVLEAVAVTPDGTRIFAVTRNGGRLIEIDAATQTVAGSTTFDPGATAGDVAVTNDRAYVSVRSGAEVVVLDISGG